MNNLRLVLVTRRFWPLVGGAERAMANLAAEFVSQGADVTLLTARWQPEWPAQIDHRGVRVERIEQPSRRFVGTWRYMRGLSAWLEAHRQHFDLAYVSMLKHDAYAVLSAARKQGFPVVLRAEGSGSTGDVAWQRGALVGSIIRSRCRTAQAIVAPSHPIERELAAAGYPADRVHYIPNGVAAPPARSERYREEARAALAAVNPLLAVSPRVPVAVFTGRLHPAKGLLDLISAWSLVARRLPEARLWIVGEGPFHRTLVERIIEAGLEGRVVLAGAFDSVDEFLAAADLFVLPSLEEGMSIALLEAMAAGLAVVASDIPANRALVAHGVHGLLVPTESPATVADALELLLAQPQQASALGAAGRQRALSQFALADRSREHLELFDRCIAAGGRSSK